MADTPNKTDMLVYTGGATLREITADQWKAEGIDGQDTLQWQRGKGIKVGDITSKAVELILERHPDEFAVMKAKDIPGQDLPPAPNGE